jgi:uncharacterized protein YmfQ (DUF2313 family)
MMRSADQIAAQLRRSFPPGSLFTMPEESNLWKVLLAAGDEISRIYQRVQDLLRQYFPSQADEMLDDWEGELGLPSTCYPAPTTTDGRRAAISSKAYQLGGQSPAYYIGVAAKLGIVITIEEPSPFYVGFHGCGDPVGGLSWRFTWIVHCPVGTTAQLACVLGTIQPSHTEMMFVEE